MGCTHYWEREPELSEIMFQSAIGDLQKVFADIDVQLAGSEGEGTPYLSLEKIVFNGVAGQSCEDFSVLRADVPRRGRSKVFSFCKTEKMPYDICVQCTLIILKHYFDKYIKTTSDGTDEGWQDACEICQRILNYGIEFRLEKKE